MLLSDFGKFLGILRRYSTCKKGHLIRRDRPENAATLRHCGKRVNYKRQSGHCDFMCTVSDIR